MASQISRLASGTKAVGDIRLTPVETSSTKSIVTREEMNDIIQQFNEKLSQLQNAFNELAQATKLAK